jgi:predicted rRNA pseudouridine synthase
MIPKGLNLLDNKVIIINKPPGITSHEISTLVKNITGASRAGHAGTLDPEVSGVLPVAIGKATKLLRYIAGKEKTYVGIIKFRKIHSKEEIERLFAGFTGELVQTPPKISAVRKVARKRTVYYLKLLEVNGRLALFETKVDAGTYIRTLCEDIGKVCGGARMEELRRTAVGRIFEKEAHTMYDLVDAIWFYKNGKQEMLGRMLIGPESLIDLPKVFVKGSAAKTILNGAQIMVPAIEKIGSALKDDKVAIYAGNKFIGIGIMKMDAEKIGKIKNGLAIQLERVHVG